MNYWFSPQLVLKASVHRVEGLRFASAAPADAGTGTLAVPTNRTLLVVTGAQFTF